MRGSELMLAYVSEDHNIELVRAAVAAHKRGDRAGQEILEQRMRKEIKARGDKRETANDK